MTTTVDLPEDQIAELDRYCSEKKLDRITAIQLAVRQLTGSVCMTDIQPFFGRWKSRQIDSRRYVDALRAEWDS